MAVCVDRVAPPRLPTATGFAALDAALPESGWPRRALTELLLPSAGAADELRLLAPALRETLRAGALAMLFDPPADASPEALAAFGLDDEQLLVVESRSRALADAGSLWALEQALASGHVGTIVAWLPPRLAADRVRRLQQAAARHDGAAFVLREAACARRPTAAPLRIALQPATPGMLTLRLLKGGRTAAGATLRLTAAPRPAPRAAAPSRPAAIFVDLAA